MASMNPPDDENENESVPTEAQQEAMLRKKFGGLLPKKAPILSKEHERAFFDSADWALRKQKGSEPNPLLPKRNEEDLRPKFEPTPHTPLPARRPSEEKSTPDTK